VGRYDDLNTAALEADHERFIRIRRGEPATAADAKSRSDADKP